jgi:Cytochrome c
LSGFVLNWEDDEMGLRACSIVFVLVMGIAFALMAVSSLASPSADSANLARGKYLVEQVGICGDCHSPHNERGEPIKEQRLMGAPIFFKPLVPVLAWADKAPNIAGLRGWDKGAAIKFLMTGIAYNDLPARPPMPQYRFNKEDAGAIVAYLVSLSPTGKSSGAK